MKTLKAQDHQKLAHKAKELIEGLQRQMDAMVGELKQTKEEIVEQGMDPSSIGDYIEER